MSAPAPRDRRAALEAAGAAAQCFPGRRTMTISGGFSAADLQPDHAPFPLVSRAERAKLNAARQLRGFWEQETITTP